MPVVEKIQAEVEAIEDTVLATTLSHCRLRHALCAIPPQRLALVVLAYGDEPHFDGRWSLSG
jgi:hypothetical protein